MNTDLSTMAVSNGFKNTGTTPSNIPSSNQSDANSGLVIDPTTSVSPNNVYSPSSKVSNGQPAITITASENNVQIPINVNMNMNQLSSSPQNVAKLRRESIAHSQGMGGVSWGSLTIGSWLRDEVMFNATLKHNQSSHNSRANSNISTNYPMNSIDYRRLSTINNLTPSNSTASSTTAQDVNNTAVTQNKKFMPNSPPNYAQSAYLPSLEEQYCKDYSCCGLSLPGLHDLLRHYEEAHIANTPTSANTTGGAATTGINPHQTNQSMSLLFNKKRPSQQIQPPTPQPQQPQAHINDPTHQRQKIHNNHNMVEKHIIQQQLRNPQFNGVSSSSQQHQGSSTVGPTATTNPANVGGNSNTNNDKDGQNTSSQFVLNGNLVDAVSTNDVFLSNPKLNNNFSFNKKMRNDSNKLVNSQSAHYTTNNTNNTNSIDLNFMDDDLLTRMGLHSQDPLSTVPSNTNTNFMNPHHRAHQNHGNDMDEDDEDDDDDDEDEDDEDDELMSGTNNQNSTTNTSPLNNNSLNMNPNNQGPNANMLNINYANMNNFPQNTNLNDFKDPNMLLSVARGNNQNNNNNMVNNNNKMASPNNNNNNNGNKMGHRQEGYIDDPARRLYVMDHEEHKPFKCPVIGCEKTYKNQNGLKYHRLHGHQNQKLHENPDGTFSILDPDSNEPYPEGMGYEKDKPYRCEVCGKRYKNLNGLKYHRGHSTH